MNTLQQKHSRTLWSGRLFNLIVVIGLILAPIVPSTTALAAPAAAPLAADMVSPKSDGSQCLTVNSSVPTGTPQLLLDICRGTPQQMWTHDDVSGQWQSGLDTNYCLGAPALGNGYSLNLYACTDSHALTLQPSPAYPGAWRIVGTTYGLDFKSYAIPVVSTDQGWSGAQISWLQSDVDVINTQGCAITYPFAATDTATYNRELVCDHVAKIQPPYVTPANAVRDPSIWPGTSSSAPTVSRSFLFNLQFKDNSYMRMSYQPRNWMSTGLYAPAGQSITVNVSDATETDLAKVYVLMGVHTDVLTPSSLNVVGGTFKRYPNVTNKIRLHVGDNLVRNPYGGVIELVSDASVSKTINVTISNAIETPHYILGTTTEADWLVSRNAPGAWAEFESDLHVLFVKSSDIRTMSFADATTLTQFYRDFVQNENNLIGVSASDPSLAQQPPQGQQRFVDDVQPSLGYAHSGYPTMYNSLMQIYSNANKDYWGLFHELGHNNQQSAWANTYGTEVTVNLFSIYNSDQFFGTNYKLVDAGRYTQAIAMLNDPAITDKWNYAGSGDDIFWWHLVFLDQIRLGFPNLNYDIWTQVIRRYRSLSAADYSEINTDQLKYDTFFKYLCDVTNTDLSQHFMAWTVPVSQSAKDYCATKQPLTRQIWLINNEQPLWYHAGSGSGGFLREYWNGISGSNISDLTSNANYPANPTSQEILSTALEGRRNFGDNYGERLRAYLYPPVTGDYRFWLSSDDAAQLLLSTDEDPAHAVSILSVSSSGYRQFDAFDAQGNPTRRSAAITLQAGQRYYIEVLHKESTGNDSVSVAWNIPATASYPGEVRKLLAAQFLSPFSTDLSMTKSLASGQSATILPGSEVNFQLTVTNNGGTAVKNVQVMDTLPTGFTVSPADTNSWSKGYRYVRFEADSEQATSYGTTNAAEVGLLDGSGAQISKTGWTATSDTESISGNPPSYAIDNNSGTWWETRYWAPVPPYPHNLIIDTGTPRTLTGFTYLRRPDGNGSVKDYKFFVSEDGTTWTQVAAGTFPNSNNQQTVTFTPPAPTKAFNTLAGPIAAGASASINLTLRASATLADGSYVNTASIVSAQETNNSRVYDTNTANNSGTANVQVSSVINHAPVAVNDAYSTNEDSVLTTAAPGVLTNDTDPDGNTLTAAKVTEPLHGTLAFNADGSFTYTPAANYNGVDSFTYRVNDGTLDSNIATVNLTINPVNDAPVATDDSYSTSEDTVLTVPASGVLSNDIDVDADVLSAVLVNAPAHGTLTLNADGSFSYTPDANWNGSDSFTYQANDGTANSNIATVSLQVIAVNDAPVATNDTYSTNEDTALSIAPPAGVLANDTDVEGGALTAVLVSNPAHGALTFHIDGSFTYTPNANYNGSDSFTYKANDGTADSNVATVNLTVSPVNDAPVAVNDVYSTNEDTSLPIAARGVLVNDTDVDGEALTAALVSGPAHGTLTLNADGSFIYTPAANYHGPDSFTYTANDGAANSNVATVNLTIVSVNDAPVAHDDSYATDRNTPLNIVVASGALANDTDVDGDALNAVLVNGPAHGTLTLNANGSFTYAPAADYAGNDSFTYRANDGTANSNIATVTIAVNATNRLPVANDDNYTTNEDTALSVSAPGLLGNDTDADHDPLTAIKLSDPAHGALTFHADGSFTYTPAANYNGPDSFTYEAHDGAGASNVATVNLTVSPVNDAPTAGNDSYSTNEDTPLSIAAPGVLGNDTDVDSSALTAVLVTAPAHGTLTLSANGSFVYTPNANWSGSDTFTYQASDGAATSNLATVDLTVNAVNDAPVANDDNYTTNEDTALTIATVAGVLANDSDVDSASLTAVLVSAPAHGTLTLNADGSFNYAPSANYNGADSFSYKSNDGVADSNVATVNLTIVAVNDAPVAGNDSYSTNEDTPLTVTSAAGVLANDTDVDGDALTAILVSSPANGTLTLNADGSLTYTPNANWNGTDSFTYKANDGVADSNVAVVTIAVNAVNDAPTAADDSYHTDRNTPLTVAAPGVLSNDTDVEGDTLSAILVSGPTNGTLMLNADGSFTYTPATDFGGNDSFTYRANDGAADSNVATVVIAVNATNRAPVAVNDSYTANEDTSLSIAAAGVLVNDTDADGNALTAVLVSNPANGTLTLNADGSFTYTPNANWNGTDSFTYQASDGAATSNMATVTIAVNAVNDAPVAGADSYATNEDTAVSVPAPGLLGNDNDVEGDALTAVLVSSPVHGTLTLNADGSFTYTPNANYNGSDSFTYKANDGAADSNVATVSLTLSSANDAPVASDDAYTTDEDTALMIAPSGVLSNDTDVDGDPLTAAIVNAPTHGALTLNADGSFTYTPAANYNGPDSFTYHANDGQVDSNLATVLLTVNPINDAPVAANDAYNTNEDTSLTVAAPGPLGNDTDIDGNVLTAVLVSGPAHGTLAVNADGSFTYTPAANYNGSDSFSYEANDGQVASTVATVNLTVNPVNDAPVAGNDSYTTNRDTVLNVSAPGVLGNDTDVEGSPLTASVVSNPAHGTLTFNADGSFTYTPAAGFSGTDTFTYQASDGAAASNVAIVTIAVNAVNHAPVAVNDAYTTNEDAALTIAAPGVMSNDTDADHDPLTAALVSNPAHGTLTFNANGSFTFVPAVNYNGSDSFTYKVNDGQTDSNVATVNVTVNAVNDAPVAVNDSYSTNRNTTLTVPALGVLSNDTDVEGSALTAALVAGPSHGTLTLNANGSFAYVPTNNYSGNDTFTYQANDGAADSNVATVSITINAANRPPVITMQSAKVTVKEGQTATDTGAVSDPDGDTVTLSASVGTIVKSNGTWSWSYATTDGPTQSQVVVITANDGRGGITQKSFNLVVKNVAPKITDISGPTGPITEKQPISIGVTFNDPGADTFVVTYNWDDGATTVQNNATSPASASHLYATPGTYHVQVTVTDDDGDSDSRSIVVVYRPNSGFVIGGGWIQSQAGACHLNSACSSATGKANFGFVALYHRNADEPRGETEFNFKAGGLNFHSEDYDWLTVSQDGHQAQYVGTGTINNRKAPNNTYYKFSIWIAEGTHHAPDTFRLKVWYVNGSSEVVVYDNGDQALGGGNILIHK